MAHSIFRRLFEKNRERAARFAEQRRHALDHDGDGNEGGSLPASERGLDELRAELEAKGGKVNRTWGANRLQQEIDALS